MTFEEIKKETSLLESGKTIFWRPEQKTQYLKKMLLAIDEHKDNAHYNEIKGQISDLLERDKDGIK